MLRTLDFQPAPCFTVATKRRDRMTGREKLTDRELLLALSKKEGKQKGSWNPKQEKAF